MKEEELKKQKEIKREEIRRKIEKEKLEKQRLEIEKKHNDTFYNVFLKMVTDYNGSGASEYEIYFNYILKNHSDKIELRPLKWMNSETLNTNSNYDYISYHWYLKH